MVEAKLEGANSLGALFAAAVGADWRFNEAPASPPEISPGPLAPIKRARSMPLATLAEMSGGYACPAASISSARVYAFPAPTSAGRHR